MVKAIPGDKIAVLQFVMGAIPVESSLGDASKPSNGSNTSTCLITKYGLVAHCTGCSRDLGITCSFAFLLLARGKELVYVISDFKAGSRCRLSIG